MPSDIFQYIMLEWSRLYKMEIKPNLHIFHPLFSMVEILSKLWSQYIEKLFHIFLFFIKCIELLTNGRNSVIVKLITCWCISRMSSSFLFFIYIYIYIISTLLKELIGNLYHTSIWQLIKKKYKLKIFTQATYYAVPYL